ncbi:MAG: hypothetical protein ACREP8_02560 [Candidatus Binatia bacterium]
MEILPNFVEFQARFWSQVEAWRDYREIFLIGIVLALMAVGAFWWRTEGR